MRRRKPLLNRTPLRGKPKPTKPAKMRPIKCRVCKELFTRLLTSQVVCTPACAQALARAKREKDAARAEVVERQADRARLHAVKPLAWHMARTQVACNAYVRLRDAGRPCICCGRPTDGEPVDAGHFISRGHAPELRFDLDNIHLQLRGCNRGRTQVPRARFRAQLVSRIGEERVALLEGPHSRAKWTREWLEDLRAEFVSRARALKTRDLR